MSVESEDRQLNLLGRQLVHNRNAFVLNNILRMREMLRYGTPGVRAVFRAVPFLLQVNTPGLPGYLDVESVPRGIYGFARSGFYGISRELPLVRRLTARQLQSVSPKIESLLLMGSTGSIGQTTESDLDYWVCADRGRFEPGEWQILADKLEAIRRWAERSHHTEVHFFLNDVEDIRNNRFGRLDEESSGQVMPRLLKEEFYRTALHVAGRVPLWWAIPVDMIHADYRRLTQTMDRIRVVTFDPTDYVDLGFPDRAGPAEFLGAAMWQAHKSRRDPFKAVLKMILLWEQAEDRLQAPWLCDLVKAAILNPQPDETPVDPYLTTVRRVLDFARESLNPDQQELVRLSVWFKLRSPADQSSTRPNDRKGRAMAAMIEQWGWPEDRLNDLLRYPHWSLHRKTRLHEDLNAFLLELYSRVASRLRADFPDHVKVDDGSLTSLNAQLLARYSGARAKVEDLPPMSFAADDRPHGLTVVRRERQWLVLSGWRRGGQAVFTGAEQDCLYAADRLARAAVWLVHNRLWTPEVRIRLVGGGGLENLTGFLSLLADMYPPVTLTDSSGQTDLFAQPVGSRLAALNLEDLPARAVVTSADLIYRTSWGEMCHEAIGLPDAATEADKYLAMARHIFRDGGCRSEDVRIYLPEAEYETELRGNIEIGFRQYAKRVQAESPLHIAPASKLKLDRD